MVKLSEVQKSVREISSGLDLGTAKRQKFLVRNLKVSQSRNQIILFSIFTKKQTKKNLS